MASILSSQGVVLATAVAVSGATVILLAIRLQKSPPSTHHHFPLLPPPSRGGAISSDEKMKKEKKNKKKKKRVHFAEDVVDPVGNSDEYRKLHSNKYLNLNLNLNKLPLLKKNGKIEEMPANRMALYNGILRDRRSLHRVAYSC
ncbi:hypothetical protein ABFS82_11G044900 [Erythranthe guttata]|uniref:Uncharacterized protein n=1 Tax=Erythranthe guttata TaxID=4155 RepID=A0A022Q714_ERYGU|nr:PREDICTED: uncharacterized protein LOC105974043 [Erythranthe guttata]EYU23013.1 hypothetical protein MIMGU_mgv1a015851mg [Erythranthe guttata]|eukprot:XP_012854539.1 PREDICTED: uncharacterized protein LOC105974043 [Erythranthe guttata]